MSTVSYQHLLLQSQQGTKLSTANFYYYVLLIFGLPVAKLFWSFNSMSTEDYFKNEVTGLKDDAKWKKMFNWKSNYTSLSHLYANYFLFKYSHVASPADATSLLSRQLPLSSFHFRPLLPPTESAAISSSSWSNRFLELQLPNDYCYFATSYILLEVEHTRWTSTLN